MPLGANDPRAAHCLNPVWDQGIWQLEGTPYPSSLCPLETLFSTVVSLASGGSSPTSNAQQGGVGAHPIPSWTVLSRCEVLPDVKSVSTQLSSLLGGIF